MTTAPVPRDREYPTSATADGAAKFAALPRSVEVYLAHTEAGIGIRAIARMLGCAPSTILRQVRKVEVRRDDALTDAALSHAAAGLRCHFRDPQKLKDWDTMFATSPTCRVSAFEDHVEREARRILRRLCEKDAFLAVAEHMEKAIVMRESVPGRLTRTAVLDRDVAKRFALNEWLEPSHSGKIARYVITETGRAALKRLLEAERASREPQGAFAEAPSPFRAQHHVEGSREVMGADGQPQRLRTNLAESPLTVLGRKRDRDGQPYLPPELVDAGERLREDFEIAQMGPRVTQNWEAFLTPRDGVSGPGRGPAEGPQAARDRVHSAASSLGPGLWDVALRVCCFLEGLETAEKRLGWSARSGKVVLRIALERLARHYGMALPSSVAAG